MSSENEHGSPCGPEQQGISGGGGSRGLQNITNRLESGHVNATSSIERSTLTAASSADGSWLVGKRGFAVRSEASSVHKISSKEDTLGKYALAQPPSGPRRANEGTGETRQRVIKLIKDETRNLLEMHVTLLAAGFVIGPSGHSIRAICEKSGANVQSCTRCGVGRCGQPHRAFVISGTPEQRERTRIIITAAVVQYEKLFSGTLRGKVGRNQYICGVRFIWSPPPKSAVPEATPLQDTSPRKRSFSGEHTSRIFLPSHFRYSEGTYTAPTGSVSPASYFLQWAAAQPQMMWCPPMSASPPMNGDCNIMDASYKMAGPQVPVCFIACPTSNITVPNQETAACWKQHAVAPPGSGGLTHPADTFWESRASVLQPPSTSSPLHL